MEFCLQPTVDRFTHCARDKDASSRRFRLQPCRDVHTVAIEIVAIDDQVAEMQTVRNTIRVSSGWSQLASAMVC